MRLTDFQIIQRDTDGYARFVYDGVLPESYCDWRDTVVRIPSDSPVYVRAVSEDDGITVVNWTRCTREEKCWFVSLIVPEGGLYRFEMTIDPGMGPLEIVNHVGVGDIYVTAGQSNMAGYASDTAYDPVVLGVHALTNRGVWSIASHPLHYGGDSIFGQPEIACKSSPALSFARRLKEKLGIPIGIIPSAVGGSPLDSWMRRNNGKCYMGMEARIKAAGGKFKGYLWMQGCSDTDFENASTYFSRFAEMLSEWNEVFGVHPILTVQLNRFAGGYVGADDKPEPPSVDSCRGWGMVRDAQRRAALELDNVYIVPSLDLSVSDGIHNSASANVVVGERLANTALAHIYNKIGQTAPIIYSAELIDDTHVRVLIKNSTGVYSMDNRADGFQIEDEEGITDCYTAVYSGGALIIQTKRPITVPAKLHYAWGLNPPLFAARDNSSMPLLACYGVQIQP